MHPMRPDSLNSFPTGFVSLETLHTPLGNTLYWFTCLRCQALLSTLLCIRHSTFLICIHPFQEDFNTFGPRFFMFWQDIQIGYYR